MLDEPVRGNEVPVAQAHVDTMHPMLLPHVPALILAPMEGVTDAPMRALQGETGAFSFAVSEFLRISHSVPPKHGFFRHVPELRSGCRTLTGLPIRVHLWAAIRGPLREGRALGT